MNWQAAILTAQKTPAHTHVQTQVCTRINTYKMHSQVAAHFYCSNGLLWNCFYVVTNHQHVPIYIYDGNTYNKDINLAETVQGSITRVLLLKVKLAFVPLAVSQRLLLQGCRWKQLELVQRHEVPFIGTRKTTQSACGRLQRLFKGWSHWTSYRTHRSSFLDSLKLFRWEFHRASGTDWYECFRSLQHICI